MAQNWQSFADDDGIEKVGLLVKNFIDRGIAKRESNGIEEENVSDQTLKTPCEPKFEPVKRKIRKSGTGCITEINDHLYEGKFSPTGADGKRLTRHIYAKTRDECEILLAEMIAKTKAEIQEAKAKLKVMQPK